MKTTIVLTMSALGIAGALSAQESAVPASHAANASTHALTIQRATGPIRIDGNLDDEGWAGAVRIRGFTEFAPREGARPPVETEVLLTYDDRYLYIGFIAHDDPAHIRATWRNRDQIWDDDNVGVLIDPYGNSAAGYFLVANPHGIPGDLLLTANGEDPSWDAIFESRGRITETGYQVEMAIPFRSLRFPNRDVQSWRINFWRNLPRTNRHLLFWAPVTQNDPCWLCQSGTLTGLRGVRSGGGLELLPALVASRVGRLDDGDDHSSFRDADPTAQLSLGAKYAFENGWTLEGTYNPDFSQVESDAAQIDVNTTFALFYPERRPFFQEGSELYDTPINVFDSRSINAPQFATKLTGRVGGTSIGYVGARDEITPFVLPFEERSAIVRAGPSISNVFRLQHNLAEGSRIGALLTDRRLEQGGSGTNLSVDAQWRFLRMYRLSAQLVGSYTQEPTDTTLTSGVPQLRFGRGEESYTARFDGETFAGRAARIGLSRSARVWSYDLSYSEASPTYRADAGFQTGNDFRRAIGSTGVTFRPQRYGFEEISPRVSGGSFWNFGNERKDLWLRPGLGLLLPRQTSVNFGATLSRERFRGIDFDDIRRASVSLRTVPSASVQAGFYVERGTRIARTLQTPVLGQGTDAELWANLRPVDRLVISPALAYGDLRDRDTKETFFAGYIARVRTEYQFNRELSFRLVTQYNDFSRAVDLEPLVIYRLNPFSIFYVGSAQDYRDFGDDGWNRTTRKYFLKFQYLFQL
jgi:hypothetical protein